MTESPPFYHILLHERLLKALRRKPPTWRAELQKTFERLQLGYWDNGTRVKLLKGAAKLVYEARVTLSQRLLFTVVSGDATAPPYALEPWILAWDVVDHDHLDRAGRLNTSPEAGFLDFQELAATELGGVPPTPEREAGAAPREAGAFRRWMQGPAAAPTRDELTQAVRWYMLDPDLVADDADWQALMDDPAVEDLELKLSRQQAATVFLPGPVLLAGTAGSGKTTVSVYRLARALHDRPDAAILYATYSPALLASVRQLFGDLYRARREVAPAQGPEFRTMPQLWRRYVTGAARRLPLARFPAFAQWYRALFARQDAALAWEEIRGIIKGACLDPHADGLDLPAYEELGRKRAPLFAAERPRLYGVYLKYQAWLGQTGQVDDIDLARLAWRQLRDRDAARFDIVICDEGQDLTELEMEVLLELCPDLHGFFFTADPQQIVNPSGFRWAEIRSRLRARARWASQTDVTRLTRNYRSVQAIVSLANALIELQRGRTGRVDDDDAQQATLDGPAPVLVTGAEKDVVRRLRHFGPRAAVVAATPAEAERVGKLLGSERVFDPAGVKGLEFDTIVIWRPFLDDAALWQELLTGRADLKEDPAARRAIRHLYVGVTRARRELAIYEPDPALAALWQQPPLRGQLEMDDPVALGRLVLDAASPEDWRREADYFAERERYRQAAECYRRAGDEPAANAALARWHESLADYHRAAALFATLDLRADQARCLEATGEHRHAATLYHALDRHADAALAYEAAGDLQHAADSYQRADRVADYRRCQRAAHEAAGHWLEAGRVAVRQEDYLAAADLYERAGERHEAARLRALAKND